LRNLTISRISNDQRVDFKVSEVEINVDRVQAGNEVNQDITLEFWNILEKSLLDNISSGEGVIDLDEKLHGLSVNITNFDTTFVGEENVIAFTFTVNTDIVFSVGRMRNKGLNQEGLDETSSLFNLLRKPNSVSKPCVNFLLVEYECKFDSHSPPLLPSPPAGGSHSFASPKYFLTWISFPALSSIQRLDSAQSLFKLSKPALPRRLIS
jgi:hypothetical protein